MGGGGWCVGCSQHGSDINTRNSHMLCGCHLFLPGLKKTQWASEHDARDYYTSWVGDGEGWWQGCVGRSQRAGDDNKNNLYML